MAGPAPYTTKTCPNCGATVPASAAQCPECGTQLQPNGKNWLKSLNATEIFLLVIGSIMLMIALVAL